MGDDLLLFQVCKLFFKHDIQEIFFFLRRKGSTLLNNAFGTSVIHKKSLSRFFFFKFQDAVEIFRNTGQKRKIVLYILGNTEGIFSQKSRELSLNPKIGSKGLLEKIEISSRKLQGKIQPFSEDKFS